MMHTFWPFCRLPSELRNDIWDEAIRDEHSVRFVPFWENPGSIIPTKRLLLPFLSASRESRSRVLKQYDTQLTVWERPVQIKQLPDMGLREINRANGLPYYYEPHPSDVEVKKRRAIMDRVPQYRGLVRLNLLHDIFTTGFDDVKREGYLYWKNLIHRKSKANATTHDNPLNFVSSSLSSHICSCIRKSLLVCSYSRGEIPNSTYLKINDAIRKDNRLTKPMVPEEPKPERAFRSIKPLCGGVLESATGDLELQLVMLAGTELEEVLYDMITVDGKAFLQKRACQMHEWRIC